VIRPRHDTEGAATVRAQDTPFDAALAAIRDGADYSLCGLTLTMNGITLAITEAQFDIAYDLMDEVDGDDSMLTLVEPPSS
jgi:hypothetical protein